MSREEFDLYDVTLQLHILMQMHINYFFFNYIYYNWYDSCLVSCLLVIHIYIIDVISVIVMNEDRKMW